jgi:pilus assembly protein FimV
MSEPHAVTEEQSSDDVDPISEADLFLNFGRDAQAEEILKEALRNTPNNHQIHLKLLGIYANRKDVNSFSAIARQLQDSGDDEAWQQAAAMGRRLEPNNPMYGGSGTIEDADSATMQTPAVNAMPDFVLDDTPAVQEAAAVPDIDFDLGETSTQQTRDSEQTMILSPADMAAAQVEAMDFDITSTIPPASASAMDFEEMAAPAPVAAQPAETASSNLDDLIFDVTSAHTSAPEAQPEEIKPAEAAPAEDGGMEFTLDFPIDDAVKESAPAAQPADIGLSGITLNLDEDMPLAEPAVESAPAEVRDEHWHEVATKLDLAKAYQEMGDATGAREILEEVLTEGDAGQRESAQAMIAQLG